MGLSNPNSPLLDAIPNLVDENIHTNLCKLPTENKVWEVVKSLDPGRDRDRNQETGTKKQRWQLLY